MKLIVGLAMVWTAVRLSRSQCVLEKEYFCSSIPNGFPEGLTSILFVVTNLGVINSTVFNSPTLESVTSLALANSGIVEIKAGAFHAFRRLTKLSLYQNSLTNLSASWLFDPGRLENLTAAHNLISEIKPNMFSGFTNLTTLNLANNQIHRIAMGSFKGLPKLTSIDLSGNNLTVLTRSVFNGLRRPVMKFVSNPWHCSCELQDFGLFLQDLVNASLLEDATSVVCRSPSSLEGIQVWNISGLNCSPDVLSSHFETGFHKAGLPALLACLVFIFFILLLFWIWLAKRDEQVRPRKEAPDPSPCMKAGWPSDEKRRSADSGKDLHAGVPRVRAKSASAVLLRTEFHPRQLTGLCGASQKHPTAPPAVVTNQSCEGRENLSNFLESGHYKFPGGSKEDFQHHNADSVLAKVCIETPVLEAPSVAAKQTLQEDGTTEVAGNGKSQQRAENSEPFLYLSITTATEEQTEAPCQKESITNAGGNCSASLRRALTWPYERHAIGQEPAPVSIRDSFIAWFFLPVAELGQSLHAGKRGLEEDRQRLRKENQMPCGRPELSREATSAKGMEHPHRREVMVAAVIEPVDMGKSERDEELQREWDLGAAAGKDDQVHETGTELNTEAKPTNPAELQKHSKVTGAVRGIGNSRSSTKAAQCPPGERNKPLPNPVSSRSRIHREIHPSSRLSEETSQTSSPRDDVLLANNDYNYINLLHEIVENHGRWTRERWKQSHRMRAVHPAKSQEMASSPN
ncbi:uncharacterized protein LOC143821902 [Paroedura picta]|uniref:uncharacterized protein LOC143821902 n=1 Tax=Paroedura picta TaxID=143630 RepID=UPI00405603A5